MRLHKQQMSGRGVQSVNTGCLQSISYQNGTLQIKFSHGCASTVHTTLVMKTCQHSSISHSDMIQLMESLDALIVDKKVLILES